MSSYLGSVWYGIKSIGSGKKTASTKRYENNKNVSHSSSPIALSQSHGTVLSKDTYDNSLARTISSSISNNKRLLWGLFYISGPTLLNIATKKAVWGDLHLRPLLKDSISNLNYMNYCQFLFILLLIKDTSSLAKKLTIAEEEKRINQNEDRIKQNEKGMLQQLLDQSMNHTKAIEANMVQLHTSLETLKAEVNNNQNLQEDRIAEKLKQLINEDSFLEKFKQGNNEETTLEKLKQVMNEESFLHNVAQKISDKFKVNVNVNNIQLNREDIAGLIETVIKKMKINQDGTILGDIQNNSEQLNKTSKTNSQTQTDPQDKSGESPKENTKLTRAQSRNLRRKNQRVNAAKAKEAEAEKAQAEAKAKVENEEITEEIADNRLITQEPRKQTTPPPLHRKTSEITDEFFSVDGRRQFRETIIFMNSPATQTSGNPT